MPAAESAFAIIHEPNRRAIPGLLASVEATTATPVRAESAPVREARSRWVARGLLPFRDIAPLDVTEDGERLGLVAFCWAAGLYP